MLEKNVIYLYYFKSNIDIEIDITPNIKDHLCKINNQENKIIKLKKYTILKKVLQDNGYDPNGLYFIDGRPLYDNLYISTSDTKTYTGFTISLNKNGLDIENKVNETKEKAINRYLANAKFDFLDATLRWTAVESYAKYLGTGLTSDVLSSNYEKDLLYVSLKNDTYITVYKDNSDIVVKEYLWE